MTSTAVPSNPVLTVYYDGACPLCQREIGFYRRCKGADRIAWIDISQWTEPDAETGLSPCDAKARFHVRDPQGRLYSGAAGFAALWRALPGFRWLGRIVGVPGIIWVAEGAYRAFLIVRPSIQRFFR